MAISLELANRLGFIVLGLTNNFAYVIMLSAAYDLIKRSETPVQVDTSNMFNSTSLLTLQVGPGANSSQSATSEAAPYCNHHSTSAILLADTIPSLTTKLLYPFFFVGLPVAYKASATALLSAFAFLLTGLSSSQLLIYAGVSCASFSSGLGESTYLSNSPLYGDVALSGWSMGTGAAGLVGAMAYAILRMLLEIEWIMVIMLIVPVSMMVAYFGIVRPVSNESQLSHQSSSPVALGERVSDLDVVSSSPTSTNNECDQDKPIDESILSQKSYGASGTKQKDSSSITNNETASNQLISNSQEHLFDARAKIRYLPTLAKYFLPLLLVYFAEYFINQGLFELIYYPEISFLDHAAQYRWFQVTYQFGVMLSRSSLDLFRIKQLWTMSILQAINAVIFLAHVSKLIHIPNFYIVIALIVYEGLLGGFTYANTFYRMKKELPSRMHEFGISTVTIADTLGIVIAGIVAMQAYNALCSLYT